MRDPIFSELTGQSREEIVLALLDRMLSCDRLVVTCETDLEDETVERLSTVQGDWSQDRMRLANENAQEAVRFTLDAQGATQAVNGLLGGDDA